MLVLRVRAWMGAMTWVGHSLTGEVMVSANWGLVCLRSVGIQSRRTRAQGDALQFLERSTEPIASDTRASWNAWLARMPTEPRAALIHRLKGRNDDHVRAALAKLVTFVLLDAVYPAVEIEPETGTGSRTDFSVNVPVRTHFEVRRKTAPEALAWMRAALPTWRRSWKGSSHPTSGSTSMPSRARKIPSMRRVRQEVEEWLDSLDYTSRSSAATRLSKLVVSGLPSRCPALTPGHWNAKYLAAQRQFVPPIFEKSGESWKVVITAHPRPAGMRGAWACFTSRMKLARRLPGQPTSRAHYRGPDRPEQSLHQRMVQAPSGLWAQFSSGVASVVVSRHYADPLSATRSPHRCLHPHLPSEGTLHAMLLVSSADAQTL